MSLHTDIPSRAQIERLMTSRDPSSVSVYLPTDPTWGAAERVELKNLAAEAGRQLDALGVSPADKAEVAGAISDLVEDDEFWKYQARSLAVFVTPSTRSTFRLPNRLVGPAAAPTGSTCRSLWTVYLLGRKKPSKASTAEFENRSSTVPNSSLKVPSSWPVSIKSPAGRSPLVGSPSPKRSRIWLHFWLARGPPP